MASSVRAVFSPVVTPFRKDLSPDAERLAQHCRWLLENNVGLAVFGTNSEANSMSVDEKADLLDKLIEDGIDPRRMMPGTGMSALTDTVNLTAHAVRLGCSGVLMLPPFYYKSVTDEGLYRSYSEVIERVGDVRLKVYLYNIPPVSHVPLSVALIERLLNAYPQTVAGIKDSSGDWNNTRAYIESFAHRGFVVFPGSESFLLQGLRNGASGCISATANVHPGPIAKMLDIWESADADSHQARLDEIRGIFAKYPMIAALKSAVAHYSGDPAWRTVRPPLVELSDDQEKSFLSELDAAGFEMPGIQPAA
ncbi:MAG TPA: dihydrodipicolinate synthase family protein [Gemmatimonadaceae bacterium]|nr:dihydrodipicolinate synthase family protein [Gemmatimonadaceae bacterium]